MVGKAPIFEHCCPHCQLLCFFGSQALDRSIRTSLGGLQSTFSLHPPQNLQVKSLTCPFDWVVRWLTISSFALTMAYWVVMGLDGLDFFPIRRLSVRWLTNSIRWLTIPIFAVEILTFSVKTWLPSSRTSAVRRRCRCT